MFTPTPLQEQLDRVRNDQLRVLIVGAGVAGLTLAQRLRVDGLFPVLVERASDHSEAGYMLALMPLVDPVIRRIGAQQAYRQASAGFQRYRLHGHTGKLLREYGMDALLENFGDYRGIARGTLLEVLAQPEAVVSYATIVTSIRQTSDAVSVRFDSGGGIADEDFDAVVLADGLHSSSRELVLQPEEVATYDTGWGGWVAWAGTDSASEGLGDEIWGEDFFVGIYPVKGLDGVIIGGNRTDTRDGPVAFVARVRSRLGIIDPRIARALAAIESCVDPYFWSLTDCRCKTWTVGRVALLGDAAAGFLPTAGVGAAMSMESANVLARRLLGTLPAQVPQALRDYERQQRPRVESAQDNSRVLARLMFRRSRVLAVMRDVLAKLVPMKMALGPIRKLLETAPQEATDKG